MYFKKLKEARTEIKKTKMYILKTLKDTTYYISVEQARQLQDYYPVLLLLICMTVRKETSEKSGL